jgi:hypothetical protein
MGAKKNFLDFVVLKTRDTQWRKTEAGLAQIIIPRDGFMDRCARLFKDTPRTFTAHLDEFGSFVWEMIDDKRTVLEIGALLGERFGTDVEPLYGRLAGFLRLLKNNGLVRFAHRESLELNRARKC